MGKPLSAVCFELAKHAAEADHELLAYILRMAAGEALVARAEAPAAMDRFSGVFDWDVGADRTYVDRHCAETFNLDALSGASGLPLSHYLRAIHPDDVAKVNAALKRATQTGGQFYEEYRVVQGSRIKWVSANGYVTLDRSGRPMRLPGVLLDITERVALPAAPMKAALN